MFQLISINLSSDLIKKISVTLLVQKIYRYVWLSINLNGQCNDTCRTTRPTNDWPGYSSISFTVENEQKWGTVHRNIYATRNYVVPNHYLFV